MARKKAEVPSKAAPKLILTADQIERSLIRISDRINELETFDVQTVRRGATPELRGLELAITDTLTRAFGEDTTAYRQFENASDLSWHPSIWVSGAPDPDYAEPIRNRIQRAISILAQAQRSLGEDLSDLQHSAGEIVRPTSNSLELSRRVFVVHGHDEGARETVARFLERLQFEPIILHEQANQGRTIIEKIEKHGDVGFAVVIMTPDDEGSVKGGALQPRARQNVVLELGYFLALLGRDRVCALKRGSIELPSDFAGVVYESMDGDGWKQSLGRELEAAGHDIDWNKVMRV